MVMSPQSEPQTIQRQPLLCMLHNMYLLIPDGVKLLDKCVDFAFTRLQNHCTTRIQCWLASLFLQFGLGGKWKCGLKGLWNLQLVKLSWLSLNWLQQKLYRSRSVSLKQFRLKASIQQSLKSPCIRILYLEEQKAPFLVLVLPQFSFPAKLIHVIEVVL